MLLERLPHIQHIASEKGAPPPPQQPHPHLYFLILPVSSSPPRVHHCSHVFILLYLFLHWYSPFPQYLRSLIPLSTVLVTLATISPLPNYTLVSLLINL